MALNKELIHDSLYFLFSGLVIFVGFGNGDLLPGVVGVVYWLLWLGKMLDRWL